MSDFKRHEAKGQEAYARTRLVAAQVLVTLVLEPKPADWAERMDKLRRDYIKACKDLFDATTALDGAAKEK